MICCRSVGRFWWKRGDIGFFNIVEVIVVCYYLYLYIGCVFLRVVEDDDDDYIVMVMLVVLLLVWNLEKV